MKPCIKCGETKPLDQFHKHPKMKDGHLNKCAVCAAKDAREWKLKNPGSRQREHESACARGKYIRKRSLAEIRAAHDPDGAKKRSLRYQHKRRRQEVVQTEFDQFVMDEAMELRLMRQNQVGGEWHIDHTVPLNHPKACGLHNGFNIQVVPAYWNIQKRNHHMRRFFGE